jgi:hypothetical protein
MSISEGLKMNKQNSCKKIKLTLLNISNVIGWSFAGRLIIAALYLDRFGEKA